MEDTETITIPIDAETYKALAEEAKRLGMTPADYAVEILQETLLPHPLARDEAPPFQVRAVRFDSPPEGSPPGWVPVRIPRRRDPRDMTPEERREAGREALAGLRALRARQQDRGYVDVAEIVRQSREDLEERTRI